MYNLGMIKEENEQILNEKHYIYDGITVPMKKSRDHFWKDPKELRNIPRETEYKSFLAPLSVTGSLVTTIRRLSTIPLVVVERDSDALNSLLLRSNLYLPAKEIFDDKYYFSMDIEIFRSSVFTFLHHPEKVCVLVYKSGSVLDILTSAAYFGFKEVIFLGNAFSWEKIKLAMESLKKNRVSFGNVILLTKEKETISFTTVKSVVTESPKSSWINRIFNRIRKKTPAQ